MKSIKSLIVDLESLDSAIRDEAAISLMDIGDPSAIVPLIRAINVPANINHRGTLVYALSDFNCQEHFSFLTNLVLTGNYEVATGAFYILNDSVLSNEQKQQITKQLNNFDRASISEEHNKDGYQYLRELIE